MARKKSSFAWSPVRELMKQVGAEIVARDAVDALIFYLEKRSKAITDLALKLAHHAKRKKISADDVELAIKHV